MSTHNEQFKPDYIVSPGEVLEETLEARGIKKRDFADRCGRTPKMISEILSGKAPITPETALQFERVLGVSARLWSNLESTYRLRLAEKEEAGELRRHSKTSTLFPVKDLLKLGYIQKTEDSGDMLGQLLKFFGVGKVESLESCIDAQKTYYRGSQSFQSNQYSVAAWLRCGQIKAESIDTKPYDDDRFKAALKEIRALTTEDIETALPKAVGLCADAGVALVFVPGLKDTRLSGAARWLSKDKAAIQLSLRHGSNDHLWFTFFHEAGHILLHGKKDLFLDDDDKSGDDMEREADHFAQNILIPKDAWKDFTIKWADFPVNIIQDFANEQEIAPGIIVARLQFQEGLLPPSAKKQNALKVWYKWDESGTRIVTKTAD